MTSFTADERETIIVAADSEDVVEVWSAQRKVITALRKNPRFTETDSGFYGTSEWAEFTIPANECNLAKIAKRVGVSRPGQGFASKTRSMSVVMDQGEAV